MDTHAARITTRSSRTNRQSDQLDDGTLSDDPIGIDDQQFPKQLQDEARVDKSAVSLQDEPRRPRTATASKLDSINAASLIYELGPWDDADVR